MWSDADKLLLNATSRILSELSRVMSGSGGGRVFKFPRVLSRKRTSFDLFVTSSIVRRAKRRYINYSGPILRFFAPQVRHVAPIGIHPHRCNDKGMKPPKLKFLLKFYHNSEYKGPPGRLRSVSVARFSQNLQSSYPVSGSLTLKI